MMKKHFTLVAVVSCLLLLIGCSGTMQELPPPPGWTTEAEQVRTRGADVANGNFVMDTRQSVVHWVGKRKWPSTDYKGTLNLSEGKLAVNQNKINSGDFIVDMNTMDIISLKASPKEYKKMMNRLKNNFFYVKDYPTINFSIQSVTDADKTAYPDFTHLITGKLTVKNTTNDITIPAKLSFQNSEVKAYSRFSINRNDYNIIYNESSLFGGIGNAAIRDSIDMALELIGIKGTGLEPEM